MDVSRQVMTAVAKPTTMAAPLNQFNNSTEFPDATFTSVVSPNTDTLYSVAWLDIARNRSSWPSGYWRPLLPDADARRLDRRLRFARYPCHGQPQGDYLITGPGFMGKLPEGLKEIKSPTGLVWIIGRTQTNGKADYAAVRHLRSILADSLIRLGERIHSARSTGRQGGPDCACGAGGEDGRRDLFRSADRPLEA